MNHGPLSPGFDSQAMSRFHGLEVPVTNRRLQRVTPADLVRALTAPRATMLATRGFPSPRAHCHEGKLDLGARCGADPRPERGRPHDEETDPRHDRNGPPVEPGDQHLLDRPAPEPGQHRGLLLAGRGDLESDEGRDRRLRSRRGLGGFFAGGRDGAEAIQTEYQDRRRRARGILGVAGRPGRASQHRRSRNRLHPSTLGSDSIVDEILPVRTDDAKDMARRVAHEESLFAGTSSGANVVAAIQVAERLGPGARVVTLMVDSGLKYLSTDVYRNRRDPGPMAPG